MVATNSTATRSSLELMLEKLQQLDDPPRVDAPPALPARPVSRARLPRPRRPLQLDDMEHNSKDVATTEKGILSNTNRVTELQSFIRGEIARNQYNYHRVRKLDAVVLIQRHARKCFQRRVLEKQQENSRKVEENKDYDRVSCSALIDLQRRVLKSEANVRRANEENVDIKMRIQEMEGKWKRHEERMESLEKMWQDELSNIQGSLALANKNRACQLESSSNQRELVIDRKELLRPQEHGRDKLHYREELLKLKLRFKAWKKDYKNKLKDTRSSLKKLGRSDSSSTAKDHKSRWGKNILPSHPTSV